MTQRAKKGKESSQAPQQKSKKEGRAKTGSFLWAGEGETTRRRERGLVKVEVASKTVRMKKGRR